MSKAFFLTTAKGLFPVALFAYFIFYLTSFSIPEHFQNKEIYAGDDLEYISIMESSLIPQVDFLDIKKHPIFPFIATPLYRIGLQLFSVFPFQKDIALVFPFALIGLINLVVAYRIFLLIFGRENAGIFSKLLTVLYGSCFSFWIFSSNTETYIITVLFQNLLIWYCAKTAYEKPNIFILGFLLILCILAWTAMVWMFFAILILFYYNYKNFKSVILKGLSVLSITFFATTAVYIFYDLYYRSHAILANSEFGLRAMMCFSFQYLEKYLKWDPAYFVTTFKTFFINSIVFTDLHSNIFLRAIFWMLIASFFAAAILGIWRNLPKLSRIFKILIGFEGVYFAFFCFFSPKTSTQYALPALLPLLIILFINFPARKYLKYVFVALLIVTVVVNNLTNYFFILRFEEFHLYGHQFHLISDNRY